MTVNALPSQLRSYRPGLWAQLLIGLSLALALALAVVGPARLIAQIEGDRGIIPVATSSDIQIGGIEVETTGKDANEARMNGWKLAQRMGWQMLKGPSMPDGQIESMVSAVVIEHEQIGPHRYVAKLGVVFDREKAGQYLVSNQGGSAAAHSAPMLVIPVLYSGGTAQVFEVRGAWQQAWASRLCPADRLGRRFADPHGRPAGAAQPPVVAHCAQPVRRIRCPLSGRAARAAMARRAGARHLHGALWPR